jgi:hypothetical protein
MRSRLEARWAAGFDRGKIPWSYEPDCFASEHGEYLPDFALGKNRRFYVEVKPELQSHQAEQVRNRMEIIRATVPGAVLAVVRQNEEGGVTVDFRLSEGGWRRWATDPDELAEQRDQDTQEDERQRWKEMLQRLQVRVDGGGPTAGSSASSSTETPSVAGGRDDRRRHSVADGERPGSEVQGCRDLPAPVAVAPLRED